MGLKRIFYIYVLINLCTSLMSCTRDPLQNNSYDSKVLLMPINQEVQIDDYKIKTLDLKTGPRAGKGFSKYIAGPNSTLALYTFEISNASRETKNINMPAFELVDGKGNRYSPSISAMTAFALSGGETYSHLSQLHPGIEKRLTVIFEIPKSLEKEQYAIAFLGYNQKGYIQTLPYSWNMVVYKENSLVLVRYFQMLILKEKIPKDLEEKYNDLLRRL